MTTLKRVEVNPDDILAPVYEIVGEGSAHVDEFTNQPDYEWRTWCQDSDRMIPLIRKPLLDYWARLVDIEKIQLKRTLQYFLNADESVPYEPWRHFPELRSKENGVGAKYFASYQDTIQPYDWYGFCLWMWEILFPSEDWHVDVANWVVTSNPTLYSKL